MLKNYPIKVTCKEFSLYGIIRGGIENEKLVILLPADSGTRIGPQRIYVEIANDLATKNISTLNIDMAPFGDSYQNKLQENESDEYQETLIKRYRNHLDIITEYLENNFNFKEYILLSISVGCLPIFSYAQMHKKTHRVILLSPNHLSGKTNIVNTKNLRTYYYKLLDKKTWIKVFKFKVNMKKVFTNVLSARSKQSASKTKSSDNRGSQIDVVAIFGEKDRNLENCLEYWRNKKKLQIINSLEEKIIVGADHSFFGWNLKKEVINNISNWL